MNDFFIAGTDQASGQIVVFDPEDDDWNGPSAVKWSWAPDVSNGFDDRLRAARGVPIDAKLRRNSVRGGMSRFPSSRFDADANRRRILQSANFASGLRMGRERR
jgi:hypothetical protein